MRITRGSILADFDIGLTERYPNTADVVMNEGDSCVLAMGDDVVIRFLLSRWRVHPGAGLARARDWRFWGDANDSEPIANSSATMIDGYFRCSTALISHMQVCVFQSDQAVE